MKNLEDVAQQITCQKSDKISCPFSELFVLHEQDHGVNFMGTMFQFLLNSDNFWEDILHYRNKKSAFKLAPKEKKVRT